MLGRKRRLRFLLAFLLYFFLGGRWLWVWIFDYGSFCCWNSRLTYTLSYFSSSRDDFCLVKLGQFLRGLIWWGTWNLFYDFFGWLNGIFLFLCDWLLTDLRCSWSFEYFGVLRIICCSGNRSGSWGLFWFWWDGFLSNLLFPCLFAGFLCYFWLFIVGPEDGIIFEYFLRTGIFVIWDVLVVWAFGRARVAFLLFLLRCFFGLFDDVHAKWVGEYW